MNLEFNDKQIQPEWVDHQSPAPGVSSVRGVKRKAPPSAQRTLDDHFSSHHDRTKNSKLSRTFPFSLEALKRSLNHHRSNTGTRGGLRALNRLPSHGAWIVSEGARLLLMNPFRVEETLLFKRLLETNILPTTSLQTPLRLTDG